MEPKDYYYNQFRSDFAEFMAKSKWLTNTRARVFIFLFKT